MRCCGDRPRMSWRMIILNLILPLNLAILVFVLFIQVWFLQFDVSFNGLEAKRYLAYPLLEILGEDPQEENIPPWIGVVVMEGGDILYPFDNEVEEVLEEWMIANEGDRLQGFMAKFVETNFTDLSIVNFIYKGQRGIVFYVDDLMPSAFKVLQKPRYLINLFLVATLFFLLGGGIMHNLKRNMKELIMAAARLRGMDFDTPLVITRDNELSDVFIAFEEVRRELKEHRKQGLRFMMSITHDLKTPLTSIRGYLEACRDGLIEAEEFQKIAGLLLNKSGLLEARIDEILELSRTITHESEECSKPFRVQRWIEELHTYFYEESLLGKKDYASRIRCPEKLIIRGNEKQLSRAVINLFDNACRYVNGDAPIRFSASYEEGAEFFILRMEDGGPGVEPEEREKIFDLFYRKDRGRNTRGMGIGLASVKYVAEVHGGGVSCLDSSLGGACFEIRLPVEMGGDEPQGPPETLPA